MKERKGKQSVSRDSQPYPFDTSERNEWNEKKCETEERREENTLCCVTLSLKAETIVGVALPGH